MAQAQELPQSIAGFSVLPILYPSSTHIIYARPHNSSKKAVRDPLPDGRTLFLVNVPPDATERELVLLFQNCGTVERVVFDYNGGDQVNESSDSEGEGEGEGGCEDVNVSENVNSNRAETQPKRQPRKKQKVTKSDESRPPEISPLPQIPLRTLRKTGQTAHVVFLDSSSIERALSTKPRVWRSSAEEPSGLDHYRALYDSLRPPLDAVRDFADSSIALYEYEIAKNKQQSKYRKGEVIVDEDGFTLVTRGGAYGQTLGGGVRLASKKFVEEQQRNGAKKKDNKEKEGFYSFQKAEKQRRDLMELKKKWEEDKARVEKLKETRMFKPY